MRPRATTGELMHPGLPSSGGPLRLYSQASSIDLRSTPYSLPVVVAM